MAANFERFASLSAPNSAIRQQPPPPCNGVAPLAGTMAEETTNSILHLARNGRHIEALHAFKNFHRHYSFPHHHLQTLPILLKCCAALSLPTVAAQLHAVAFKSGSDYSLHVLTSLVSTYSRLRLPLLAACLFCPSAATPTAVYNALISGFSINAMPSNAMSLFRTMLRFSVAFGSTTFLSLLPSCSCLFSGKQLHAVGFKSSLATFPSVANALLTAYARCRDVKSARQTFDTMLNDDRDLITWNAMISAYAQNSMAPEVLELYRHMTQKSGVEPDAVTFVGVLSSSANIGARDVGKEVDSLIAADSFLQSNTFLGNALVNMHARCGDLDRAWNTFDKMTKRTVVTWTAIISGYGMHGHGDIAVRLFENMLDSGVLPDGIAFLSVISACSHAGLTKEGLHYLCIMERTYGLVPGVEHYACIVDLLGRAGRLQDAWEFIQTMPVEADGAVWGSLLGACRIHKDLSLAELAFEHVITLEPANVGYYVLMSNIYSDASAIDGITKVRTMMKQRGLKKEPGCSYVEHKKKIHLFLADDQSHPQREDIYKMVAELELLSKAEDGKYDGSETGVASEEAGVHSEKLALAFALLNTDARTSIVVIKNLRVCGDCHRFMKFASKVVDRELVVRDASRFHHFRDGLCSCKEYW